MYTMMAKLVLLSAAVLTSAAAAAVVGEERIGRPVPLADPFILYDSGTYYAYGTGAADGIPVWISSDLKSWARAEGKTRGGLALHKDDVWGEKNYWAPEVYKCNDGYVMTYSVQERVCFAFAKSPLGPFIQTEKVPFFAFGSIDGSLFRDDDGRVWLFFVKFEGGNVIYQAEMERDLKAIKPGSMRRVFGVTEPWERPERGLPITEGPFVVKTGGRYVLTYSANSLVTKDYAVGAATSEKIEGPWKKYAGNPILRSRFGLFGTGHHALFKDAEGKWKIVFHSHNSDNRVHPRLMHVAEVDFINDQGAVVPKIGNLIY